MKSLNLASILASIVYIYSCSFKGWSKLVKKDFHRWVSTDYNIPANFFWDVGVRFLSWECWDFWKRHNHFRRRPKSTEGEVIEKTLIHKIRDREEGIVIYSFYTWFSFVTWVWVNIFLEIVSSKTTTTHIFQSGVRNWSAGVSGREIEVFNPQTWDSRLRRESWQVYYNKQNETKGTEEHKWLWKCLLLHFFFL